MKKLRPMLAVTLAVILPTFLLAAEPPSKTASQESRELVGVMEFKGVVHAARAADISPRFDGLVQSVNFKAGDLVKKGTAIGPAHDSRAAIPSQDRQGEHGAGGSRA